MFKLFLLGLLAIVSIDASYHYRYIRAAEPDLKAQANEIYSKAKEHFPVSEWNTFWNKLVQASGTTAQDAKNKLKANNYDMDMTLEELGAKAKDYPALTQQWNKIKSQYDSKAGELQGQSLQQLYDQAKSYIEAETGGPVSPEQFQSKIGNYLSALYASKVTNPEAKSFLDKAKAAFPQSEFQAFWNQLKSATGKSQGELQSKLQANNFDMDMTLEQLGGQLKSGAEGYPMLKQQYEKIKSQWGSKTADFKDDSLQELLQKGKAYIESNYGPIDANSLKQYLTAAFSAGGKRRYRRDTDLKAQYNELKQKWAEHFPKAEFDAFLAKLGDKAKLSKQEFKNKLKENEGNLDLTVEEAINKVKTEYPDQVAGLQTQYNQLKTKFDEAKANLDESTLNDLWTKSKAYLPPDCQTLDTNKLKKCLAFFFAGKERRYRREVPAEFQPKIQEFKKQFGEKFPKNEWDTFWPKFQEFMSSIGKDAKTELAKHDGNMDLTLNEVKDKAFNQYPALKASWEKAKTQMDKSVDKADETTLRDAFSFMKTHAESVLGRPITEDTLKEFIGNSQAYLTTLFSRMQARYW